MRENLQNTIPLQEGKEKEPIVKYQLMCNSAERRWYVNTFTEEQVQDFESHGYVTQEGDFKEVGRYDTPEQLSRAESDLRIFLAS